MAFLHLHTKTIFSCTKRTLLLVFFLFGLAGPSSAGDWQDINWQDYADARELNSDKPIFVFAELHFCSACKKMKDEVFNQSDIIKLLNQSFIPVNMKAFGIFPNELSDLQSENGDSLTLIGSPAIVVVYKNQYKLLYGFQNKAQVHKLLTQSLEEIAATS